MNSISSAMYRSERSEISHMSSSVTTSGRGKSVYGGAGGRNVRVSYASGFDPAESVGKLSVADNKKVTMHNLNDRLATYMDRVRTLESANAKLELQIQEWCKEHAPTDRDNSKYEAMIDDLRRQIRVVTLDNAGLMLQIDNARLAAEDFRIKFENEQAVRMSVEGDINGLRKVLEDLTMSRADLEIQVEGLSEELAYLNKSHAEESAALKQQVRDSSVNVAVEAKPQESMAAMMNEVRAQYEGITNKNRNDTETWYKIKFDDFNKEVNSHVETLQTTQIEVHEMKRSVQSLKIEQQAQVSLKAALESQLTETDGRYNIQMSQLQAMVVSLETELGQVKADIERHSGQYQELLDVKTKHEMEIADYRRLIDGMDAKTAVVTTQVHAETMSSASQRMVMIEELVDGRVVSRHENMSLEIIKK